MTDQSSGHTALNTLENLLHGKHAALSDITYENCFLDFFPPTKFACCCDGQFTQTPDNIPHIIMLSLLLQKCIHTHTK